MKVSKASLMVVNFSRMARRNSSMAPRAPTGEMTAELRSGDRGLRMEDGWEDLALKLGFGVLADSLMGREGAESEARRPPRLKAMDWRLPWRPPLPGCSSPFLAFLFLGKMRFKTWAAQQHTCACVGRSCCSCR